MKNFYIPSRKDLLAFLFLFSFAPTLFLSATSHAVSVDRIIAVVNDQIITEIDIQKLARTITKKGMLDDLLVDDPKSLTDDRAKMVDYLINEKIIDSEVKKQGLNVTVERVEQEMRNIAAKNNINRDQLKKALREQGVVFSEYQDFLKKRLERQALIEKAVTSKVKISDDEVAAYYLSKGGHSGREVFEYTLAHIMFLPKSGDVDNAKLRADAILKKLREGVSFESLASQHSEDPKFSTGGLLGTFRSGEFLKELEDVAKDMAVGSTSEVVRSKNGFHIVKLLSKRLVADPEFEKNKEELRGVLYQRAFKKQFSFWMDQRRQDAFIRINRK